MRVCALMRVLSVIYECPDAIILNGSPNIVDQTQSSDFQYK